MGGWGALAYKAGGRGQCTREVFGGCSVSEKGRLGGMSWANVMLYLGIFEEDCSFLGICDTFVSLMLHSRHMEKMAAVSFLLGNTIHVGFKVVNST